MNGVLTGREGMALSADGGVPRSWRRLHAWSVRQRLGAVAVTAVLAATLAGFVCTVWDLAGLGAAEAGLTDAQRALAEARETVTRLPALRAAAAPRATQSVNTDSTADDIRNISGLASGSGLSLLSLEPTGSGGSGAGSFRTLKLVAQGGFAQLQRFLAGLAEAPQLVVPVEIAIKCTAGDVLSIAATLQVFDRLPALPLPALVAEGEVAEFDPFANRFAAATGTGSPRLAGILHDGKAIVALVETSEGTEAVKAGQPFGGGRVERIAPSHVVLSSSGASQTLTWTEDKK